MKFNADKVQREVLCALLDKYENSKTYKGENQVHQTFSILPSIIMQEYDSDFADVEKVHLFEEELDELAGEQLIRLERKGTVIQKIFLNQESIPACYEILGREDKNAKIREQILFYESYSGKNPVLTRFCTEQIRLLESGHKPEYLLEEAAELLSLCLFILENKKELLERELSIVRFGNSKLFEKKFRTRVCRILQKYGDYAELLDGVDDSREREQIILGEHSIYSNPSYVYIKGEATLTFCGLPPVKLSLDTPVAYSSESLQSLERIEIHDSQVMTIENLTSFNRMKEKGYFYLFLSGYHNTAKQRLLGRIAAQNREIRWFHFGDFDPDGFLILEHLKKKTGIDFRPVHMGSGELEKYQKYGRPMEKNDRKKAETLLEKGMYPEEMAFMLEQDCKIEQEIVSWMLENKRILNFCR
ncbi:MAG: DUF2220 domain-containing protein [Lachnospiraceae bacterium]|nr:DUF2220 domain-containing protein [Lachnospiraceae bacterium]